MSECFISVDIETTGPTPGTYSMFEIGATRIERPKWDFRVAIRLLPEAGFELEALDAIGRSWSKVKRLPLHRDPREAMRAFADWVAVQSQGYERAVFVANNAPFDWMFVAWYFKQFGVKNPFGHSALDMKAYFMGLTGCSWEDATLKNMAKRAGVSFEKLPHRALDDAIIQEKIFSALLNSQRKKS